MTDEGYSMLTADYLSGLSLETVARRHHLPRYRVVQILQQGCIPLRTASQSRHMTQQRMGLEQRRRNTLAARTRWVADRKAMSERAKVVRTWCEQRLSPAQSQLIEALKARQLDAKALFPAGEANVWVALPHALIAILPIPARNTLAARTRLAEDTRYLTGRGFFVVHYSGQLTDLELDTIEAMARSRMGSPVDLTQKARIRASLAEPLSRLHQDYRDAVALAQQLFAHPDLKPADAHDAA